VKALVKYARGKGVAGVRDVPEREPGPGQVRIKVEYPGICASDPHVLNDDIGFAIRTPVVMGHEFSGTIDRLGGGAGRARPMRRARHVRAALDRAG
jgi:L-iditol 2-dehydrogenase